MDSMNIKPRDLRIISFYDQKEIKNDNNFPTLFTNVFFKHDKSDKQFFAKEVHGRRAHIQFIHGKNELKFKLPEGGLVAFKKCDLIYSYHKLRETSSLTKEQKEELSHFITRFLHPYINGYISPKEESDHPRRPLMEQIFDHFEVEEGDQAAWGQLALDIYIERAVYGLYINQAPKYRRIEEDGKPHPYRYETSLSRLSFEKGSEEFNVLMGALQESLPKDFPVLYPVVTHDLFLLVEEALKRVNLEREQLQGEIQRYKDENDPQKKYGEFISDQQRKADILERNHLSFLEWDEDPSYRETMQLPDFLPRKEPFSFPK